MAKKKKVEALSETDLRLTIEEMYEIKQHVKAEEKRFEDMQQKVMATMPVGDVRQYGTLRCTIVQNIGRGLSYKAEMYRLAHLLYPTVSLFRKFLHDLAKRYPKNQPSKAYAKLVEVKED